MIIVIKNVQLRILSHSSSIPIIRNKIRKITKIIKILGLVF